MRVRVKQIPKGNFVFANGARHRAGAVFDLDLKPGQKLPKFLEEVGATVPVNVPEVLPPKVPGQAPQPGAPAPEPEALSQVNPEPPVNGSFPDPEPEEEPADDPDAKSYLD